MTEEASDVDALLTSLESDYLETRRLKLMKELFRQMKAQVAENKVLKTLADRYFWELKKPVYFRALKQGCL
jgi:hypothetical protein